MCNRCKDVYKSLYLSHFQAIQNLTPNLTPKSTLQLGVRFKLSFCIFSTPLLFFYCAKQQSLNCNTFNAKCIIGKIWRQSLFNQMAVPSAHFPTSFSTVFLSRMLSCHPQENPFLLQVYPDETLQIDSSYYRTT